MEELTQGRTAPKPTKHPKPKKSSRFFRFLAFLLTLAMVLGAVVLVVNYDKLNFDGLKRWFTYRNLERNEDGQTESFHYEGDTSSAFAVLDGDLLVCSTTGVRLYSGSGQAYVEKAVSLTNPVASTAGSRGLAYDAGGQWLAVYANREELFSMTLSTGNMLLSADLNENGWLAAVTQQTGYKGIVTVYDSTYAPRMEISLSSRFVMDAAVSPDNQSVALLTIGLTDGSFESRVELYRLDRDSEETAPDWTCSVGNGAILDLRWNSSGIWALGESALYVVGSDGTLTGSYDYGGRYLKSFSLEGDGTAVLLLGKYRAGTSSELVVVDRSCQVQASQSLEEQVLSLSAAGRYIALLTADRLDIYDHNLGLCYTLTGTQSAVRVLQRSDGSAMLIDSATARLYVPD